MIFSKEHQKPSYQQRLCLFGHGNIFLICKWEKVSVNQVVADSASAYDPSQPPLMCAVCAHSESCPELPCLL